MASPRSAWIYVDLSPAMAVANTDWLVAKPCPVNGTVKEVWLSINTVLTTGGGLVTVHKNAVNLLSATNVNLGAAETPDLTAATAESQTLTTNGGSLRVTTTDTLRAGWTLTTAAITNGAGCLVVIEPDQW